MNCFNFITCKLLKAQLCFTTFIPYREFENVLGVVGIDQYTRYGGTMSLGGKHCNKDSAIFANKKSTLSIEVLPLS